MSAGMLGPFATEGEALDRPEVRAICGGQLAAVLDALDFAADELRDRVANCGDCDAHPADLCGTCENRLARAGGWDTVAGTLRGQQ
jgi:hypothetical protein